MIASYNGKVGGIDSVSLHFTPGNMPVEMAERSLRLFSKEVMPKVSGALSRLDREAVAAAFHAAKAGKADVSAGDAQSFVRRPFQHRWRVAAARSVSTS